MKNFFKLHKIIMLIFLICALIKIKGQINIINNYNSEISAINDKIAVLKEQEATMEKSLENSKENNEDIARKDLKMYYPNETPYKGY